MIGSSVGRYKIEALLGAGGMGEVYRAEDASLGRPAALKFLAEHLLHDEEAKQRFLREAKAAAAITHPNICPIYEVGEEGGKTFLAMAYLEGESLEDRIAKGPLQLKDALAIGRQLSEGLEAAHEKGIVHRDIKPANVMVDAKGHATILDFGLARLAEASKLTRQDQTVGTAAYMSPEQMQGEEVDRRADVWALGCVLYEMVAGVRPFKGEYEQALAFEIVNQAPEPLTGVRAGVPMELEVFVAKALAKEPSERYQSAAELAVDLSSLLKRLSSGRSQILRSAAAPASGEAPPAAKSSWLPAAALAGVLGLAIGAGAVYRLGGDEAAERQGYRVRQLTFDDGLSFEPSLSHDGNLLAYSSDSAGRGDLDIWVKQVSGGNPIRLTDDSADDRQPDISPDGSRIVFRSDRDGGGIYVMPALGGDPVLLVQQTARLTPLHPRFSPDGKTVSYWVGPQFLAARDSRGGIYIVAADGGEPRRIAENLDAAAMPVWSPDGESVLVLGWLGNRGDWWLASTDGGPATPTGAYSELESGLGLVPDRIPYPWRWEYGSGSVYFTSGVVAGSIVLPRLSNLWRLPISLETGHTAGPVQPVTTGPGSQLTPDLSIDGRLAFADAEVNPNIWSAPLDPDRFVLTGDLEPVLGGVSWESRPSASWDGAALAFRSDRSGGWDFWLKDLASGAVSQLTRDRRDKSSYVLLSADGSRAAYAQEGAAFAVSAAGGPPRQVCESCAVVDWFADGRRLLAFTREQGRQTPGILDADTGRFEPFAIQTSAFDPRFGNSAVSPSGRWIATSATSVDTEELLLLLFSLDELEFGAEVVELTGGANPKWHPSGRALFFMSEHESGTCLTAVRFDPQAGEPIGEPFFVRHFHDRGFPLRGNYWVSRDRLFVGIHETTGNIWMLEPQTD